MDNERETVVLQRRGIRAAADLPAGTLLERTHLSVLRPCPPDALPPSRLEDLVGRRLVRAITAGELIRSDDVG
jgi:N-acetylneuraminate synthase